MRHIGNPGLVARVAGLLLSVVMLVVAADRGHAEEAQSLKGVALPPVIGENQAQMQDIVGEELTEAAAGRKTVEEALASAEKRVNPLLG